MLLIGVLAMQGDIREHLLMVQTAGYKGIPVKSVKDLDEIAGLIIPGGESTTITKLAKIVGLWEELKMRIKKGLPVFGTCAGMIVLSKGIKNYENQETLGVIDIIVERNAYGRQVESFEEEIDALNKKVKGVFIRAPKIVEIGENVEILGRFNGDPVLVQQENVLAASFHPELTTDISIHKYFIEEMVLQKV